MPTTQPQIVFTDLDGTLLNSRRKISPTNLTTLRNIGNNGIIRVIATGRSLYSFNQAIPADFPADYLIFSSGAGILDFKKKELLFSAHHGREDTKHISGIFDAHRTDHMIHYQVPENHRFIYRRHSADNPDFTRRISIYSEFAENGSPSMSLPDRSAQIIAVLPPRSERFNRIKDILNGYQVTRTTSPLDHTSLWMEVYPADIHKGSSAAWLCCKLGVSRANTMGIGNDYNDTDLLNFTAQSFAVANSPQELRDKYTPTHSNDDDGFSAAVRAAMSSNISDIGIEAGWKT